MQVEKEPTKMQVEIWSDIVCVWCTIGREKETALSSFEHRDKVEINGGVSSYSLRTQIIGYCKVIFFCKPIIIVRSMIGSYLIEILYDLSSMIINSASITN